MPESGGSHPVVGRLLSVNVGIPKDVRWQGKTIFTGVTPGIATTPVRRPHPPAGQPGDGPTIQFARSHLAIPWSSEYSSLLELAEACDVPVRWACRTGVCHTCETTLIAGDLRHRPEPVEPPADGSALICCSQPRDDVILDL